MSPSRQTRLAQPGVYAPARTRKRRGPGRTRERELRGKSRERHPRVAAPSAEACFYSQHRPSPRYESRQTPIYAMAPPDIKTQSTPCPQRVEMVSPPATWRLDPSPLAVLAGNSRPHRNGQTRPRPNVVPPQSIAGPQFTAILALVIRTRPHCREGGDGRINGRHRAPVCSLSFPEFFGSFPFNSSFLLSRGFHCIRTGLRDGIEGWCAALQCAGCLLSDDLHDSSIPPDDKSRRLPDSAFPLLEPHLYETHWNPPHHAKMLPPALLGLLAAILPLTAAKPIIEMRQDGACTVLIGSCNDQSIELVLTECACACLQNSCALVGLPSLETLGRFAKVCRLGGAITRRGHRLRGRIWAGSSRSA